ncbi:MAG: DUF4167 domain-containing protein [Alphaproteobacteria bacterium]|nr:DUF4167 domain-containing protein [Alphaproteobacteria bacterium]
MKQNNHNRQNRRFNNRNNRPTQTIYRNTCLDSSGPAGKLRGTPLQLNEKYAALAKDASTANDMILAEQYRQYADHYMRLQNLAIENENALRASKEAQRMNEVPEANVENVSETAEEPIQEEETISADLSVPVQQMNEQAETNPATE